MAVFRILFLCCRFLSYVVSVFDSCIKLCYLGLLCSCLLLPRGLLILRCCSLNFLRFCKVFMAYWFVTIVDQQFWSYYCRFGTEGRKGNYFWGVRFSVCLFCSVFVDYLLNLFVICNSNLLRLLTSSIYVALLCSIRFPTCFSLNKPSSGKFA